MRLFQKAKNSILVLLYLLPMTAFASQIKIAADGSEVVGKISNTDVNRITLIGDRVKSVKSSKGGYEFTNDTSSGDVYVRSLPDNMGGALNVFLISEAGYTYKLLLTPLDIPSEQIFIKNPAIISEDKTAKNKEPLPYTQELVELLKAMKKGEVLAGYKINTLRKASSKPNGIKMTLQVSYRGPEYEGTIFELKNITKDTIQLDERAFSMPGVRAIKFDRLALAPGDTVNLYMVGDHEK